MSDDDDSGRWDDDPNGDRYYLRYLADTGTVAQVQHIARLIAVDGKLFSPKLERRTAADVIRLRPDLRSICRSHD